MMATNIKQKKDKNDLSETTDFSHLYGFNIEQGLRALDKETLKGNAKRVNINSFVTSPTSIVPSVTDTLSLGSDKKQWKSVFATEYLGGDNQSLLFFKNINSISATQLNDTLNIISSDGSLLITENIKILDFQVNAGATAIITDNFNKILTATDDTVQKALDTLDDGAVDINGDSMLGNLNTLGIINEGAIFSHNQANGDFDFKVGSVNADNTIYVDASTDNVGIGTSTPGSKFEINGISAVKQGLSSSVAKTGGVIFDHYASVGNGTTVETDLYSDSIPASSLGTNGNKLQAEYGGVYVNSATATRQIKIYFAGTVIFDTGALTLSLSSAWTAYVSIIRVSASIIRYMISFATEGAALAAYTAVGELTGLTLTNANILKITGQAAGVGAATNDIVAMMNSVSWLPAA